MSRCLALVAIGICTLASRSGAGQVEPAKPVNLDRINTEADEDDPFITADQLSLWYASNAGGTWDVMVARRTSSAKPWAAGKVHELSTKEFDERSPFVYGDKLYFATNRIPAEVKPDLKNFDLWYRAGTRAPLPLIGISEPEDELHPWITAAGREFYFSRKTKDGYLLFLAKGPTPGPIGAAKPVGFPPGFHHATISGTGLTMFLQGPENDRSALFRSTRSKIGAAWSKPEPITNLSHAESKRGDLSPCLSPDGTRLYFVSDRPGGKGGLDIWYVPTMQLKPAGK